MRYLLGFVCVCALGVIALVRCSSESGPQTCEDSADCDDGNACTRDDCDREKTCRHQPIYCPGDNNDCVVACNPAMGCDATPVADGTSCAGGTCQSGACQVAGSVLPCTEQGIRNAIAAGGGPYTFACDGPSTLAEGFKIDNDVILDGEGQLFVDSFEVEAGVTAELRAFGMTDQSVWADGSGIWNSGTLKITDSSIWGFSGPGISNSGTLELVNSSVSHNWYGGIFNGGTLTITDSIISLNRTGDLGGGGTGVFNSGTLTITNSTISDNFAWYSDLFGSAGIYNSGTATIFASTVSRNQDTSEHGGGGIHNDGGWVTLTNSTVSGNEASGPGGGIFNSGILNITNGTVSGNTATEASAIYSDGTTTLANSLIDGNCGGSLAVTSGHHNIESPSDTCSIGVSVPDLKLGPLQNNGGPTETHALTLGSPAIDQIPEADCRVTTDQRGEQRPAGPDPKRCDAGSFERQEGD